MAENYPLQHDIDRFIDRLRAVERVLLTKRPSKALDTIRKMRRLLYNYVETIKKEDAETVTAFFVPENLAWLKLRLRTMATEQGVKLILLKRWCDDANVDYSAIKADYDVITAVV